MNLNSDDMLSSPDPLNDSGIYTSPEKTRRRTSSKPRPRTSLPMNSSSPNKQTFELAVGSGISPQKLFVTVEAANSSADTRYPRSVRREVVFPSPYRLDSSPSGRRERTRTTYIPLRGLSDTEDAGPATATPKRGRGRPRKSGTPIPKRTDGRRTTQNFDDDDDEDIWDLSMVNGRGAGKGKGRSRSRSRSTAKKGPAKKAKATPRLSQGHVKDGTTPKRGRGRPKKVRQEESAAQDEAPAQDDDMETLHDLTPNMNATAADVEDFGTMRSNTPSAHGDVDSDHPDMLLARFDSMQTPTEKGWSSPRGVSSGRPGTSRRKSPAETMQRNEEDDEAEMEHSDDEDFEGAMDYTSDRESHQQSFGMGSPRSDSEEEDAQDGREIEDVEDGDGSEAGDNVGELREFDTIMESEDFSMISVDSLREHLSSPPNDDQNTAQESNSLAGALLSVTKGVPEDSFSTIAQSVLDAASPIKNQPPFPAFRGQHLTQPEDSFSSIAPSILEAASPKKADLPAKQHDSTPKDASGKSSSPGLPSQLSEPKKVHAEYQKTPTYMNAFQSATAAEGNEIVEPQSVMDEPTVAAADTDMLSPVLDEPTDNTPRPTSSRRSSHWSGLATPRESASPGHELLPNDAAANVPDADTFEDQDTHMDSSPPPYVSSSPPQEPPEELPQEAPQEMPRRYTYTAHIRGQRMANADMIETPSIVFSSPSLPALNQQAPIVKTAQLAPAATTSSGQRPPLSPITRAGQVLQDVVVLPSSPRTRSQSLGSPFTSPFKSRGGSGTPVGESSNMRGQSQPINGRRLSNFNLFTNVSDGMKRDIWELSSQGAHVVKDQRPSSSRSVLDHDEDPFRSDPDSQKRLDSSADTSRYILGLPNKGHVPYPNLKKSNGRNEDSEGQKPRQSSTSENAFPAPSQPTIDRSIRMTDTPETHTQCLEREWASERMTVSQQIDAASTSQVIVLSSENNDDAEVLDEQDEDGDGDIDIWQDEARNSSSVIEDENVTQSSSAGKQPSKQTVAEKPRRGKIPSPWRKGSRRLVYSDEIEEMSSPAEPSSKVSYPEKSEKTERPLFEKRPTASESSRLEQDSEEYTGIWQMQMPQIAQKPRPRTHLSQLDFSALLEPSPRKSLPTPVTSEPAGPSNPTSQRKASRYSSPLVTAAKNRLNVSPPKTLQSSPFANTDNVEYEQDGYLSPNNENFGSDADWPDDMSTPAKTTTTTKKSLSPFRSVVQKSVTSNTQPSKTTPQSQTEAKPKESPFLSTTEWSKSHWKILDKILQHAKPLEAKDVYPLGEMFVNKTYFVGFEVERDEQGFATSEILGKRVKIPEDFMILNQWHIEIIAIFREVVAFDDERALAKRLFGLISAEERRRKRVREEIEREAKAQGLIPA